MVEFIYLHPKFFINYDQQKLKDIVAYCQNRGIKVIVIEDIANEFTIKWENYQGVGQSLVSKVKSYHFTTKSTIDMYRQHFNKYGLVVVLYDPKKDEVDIVKKLVDRYGAVLTGLMLFVSAILDIVLITPINFILNKLGKRDATKKLYSILSLPPYKELLKFEISLMDNLRLLAEKLEKDVGSTLVLALQREKCDAPAGI